MDIERSPGVPEYALRRVTAILEAERLAEILPAGVAIRARMEAVVKAGSSLEDAHATWLPDYLDRLPGLPPLARQPVDALVPEGLARVVVECVEAPSGGMSSHFGFRGLFVSILVSIPLGCVWDARVDEAR